MNFELNLNRKTPSSWLGGKHQAEEKRQGPQQGDFVQRDTVRVSEPVRTNLFRADRQSISPIRYQPEKQADTFRHQDRLITLSPAVNYKEPSMLFKQDANTPFNLQSRGLAQDVLVKQQRGFDNIAPSKTLIPKSTLSGANKLQYDLSEQHGFKTNFRMLQSAHHTLKTLLNKYMIGYFVLFVIAEVTCYNALQNFSSLDSTDSYSSDVTGSSWVTLMKLMLLRGIIVYIFYNLYYHTNIYQFDNLEIVKTVLRADWYLIANLIAEVVLLWISINTFQKEFVIFTNSYQSSFFSLCKYFIVTRFVIFNLFSSRNTDFESLNDLNLKQTWSALYTSIKNHLISLTSMITLNTLLYLLVAKVFEINLGSNFDTQFLHAEHIWNMDFMPLMVLLYIYTIVAIELYTYAIRFSISTTLKHYYPTRQNTQNILELLFDLNCDNLNENFINYRIERNTLTHLIQNISLITENYFSNVKASSPMGGQVNNWRMTFSGYNTCLKFMNDIMIPKNRPTNKARIVSFVDLLINFREVILKDTETRKQYLRSYIKIHNWLHKLQFIKELILIPDDFPKLSSQYDEIREFTNQVEKLISNMSTFIAELRAERYPARTIERYEFFVWNLEDLHQKINKRAASISNMMPRMRNF